MADKVQKNQIADILLDFYDEYDSNVINRPMIPNIYAGKIIDSLQEEPSKFDTAIQEGDDVRYNEDLGCRVNLSQLKRVAKKEEPVSEDLEQAIDTYLATYFGGEKEKQEWPFLKKMAIYFATWQKKQFEKNRLAACDRQTEEEAEVEQSFVMGIIECEHRQPTFDDAIKYGMRLQKEQIKEALLSEVLPYFMHGGEADEVVAKLDEVLNQKK